MDDSMDVAPTTVLLLALALAATGAIAWGLGRSRVGRRIWVGIVAAVAGALGVVYVAYALMAP
jgi:drug/metabolite transporter (DMT)-like permease